MRKLRVMVLYWGLVAAWMVLIFSASGDAMSFEHSSKILGPLLKWLFPRMGEETLHSVVFLIRKCGHLTEYAILAGLAWRALWATLDISRRRSCWVWALAMVFLYAATDEWHQSYVPTRQGRVADVLIDTVGGALGLAAVWAAHRLAWRWSRKTQSESKPSE